jgi:hypothetical protein
MLHDRTFIGVEVIRMVMRRVCLHRRHLHFRLAAGQHILVVLVNGFSERQISFPDGYAGVDEALAVLQCIVATLTAI